MLCPKCDGNLKVIDSRDSFKNSIMRRRECLVCRYRFTTYEGVVTGISPKYVVSVLDSLIANIETAKISITNKQMTNGKLVNMCCTRCGEVTETSYGLCTDCYEVEALLQGKKIPTSSQHPWKDKKNSASA